MTIQSLSGSNNIASLILRIQENRIAKSRKQVAAYFDKTNEAYKISKEACNSLDRSVFLAPTIDEGIIKKIDLQLAALLLNAAHAHQMVSSDSEVTIAKTEFAVLKAKNAAEKSQKIAANALLAAAKSAALASKILATKVTEASKSHDNVYETATEIIDALLQCSYASNNSSLLLTLPTTDEQTCKTIETLMTDVKETYSSIFTTLKTLPENPQIEDYARVHDAHSAHLIVTASFHHNRACLYAAKCRLDVNFLISNDLLSETTKRALEKTQEVFALVFESRNHCNDTVSIAWNESKTLDKHSLMKDLITEIKTLTSNTIKTANEVKKIVAAAKKATAIKES